MTQFSGLKVKLDRGITLQIEDDKNLSTPDAEFQTFSNERVYS